MKALKVLICLCGLLARKRLWLIRNIAKHYLVMYPN